MLIRHIVIIHNDNMTRREYNKTVDEISDALYAFALRFSGHRHLALDAVQDSLVVLWEHIDEVSYDKARSYLFKVLNNKLIDIFRHKRYEQKWTSGIQEGSSCNAESFELRDSIQIALGQLPDIQRTLVILKEVEGFSCKEIAEMTDLSEQQVMTYLFRAKVKLRKLLEHIGK